MINDDITDDQLKIKVHHIGGIGRCGPTEVLAAFGKDIKWVIYDADKDALTSLDEFPGRDYSLVNNCIGGANSKGVFNITNEPSASSMLLPSPDAADYTFLTRGGDVRIWREHARVVKSFDVEINTLDSLVKNKKLPSVDFLSIDAQGAELDIINGASKMIKSSTIGVVCEVAFDQLYFALDILRKLREKKSVSLEKLAEQTQLNYIKLLRDLLQVADAIEAEKTDSSSSNKMALFTKFVIARTMRIFSRKLGNKNINNYHSRVSRIFHAYGLHDLAEKHDTRFVKNLLYPLSRVMKCFFNLLP